MFCFFQPLRWGGNPGVVAFVLFGGVVQRFWGCSCDDQGSFLQGSGFSDFIRI